MCMSGSMARGVPCRYEPTLAIRRKVLDGGGVAKTEKTREN